MKTRDKIVYAALELFNEKGERNVTTNHIAAHMEISPGNLYYHYANKQEIVREIFAIYSSELLEHFDPKGIDAETEEGSVVLLKRYLDSIFTLMWKYRFFYSNLPEILQRDEELHDRYLTVQIKSKHNLEKIVRFFVSIQFLSLSQNDVTKLTQTLHLIASSWLSYQSAMSLKTEVTTEIIHQGIEQMLSIIKPHATQSGLDQLKLVEDSIRLTVE